MKKRRILSLAMASLLVLGLMPALMGADDVATDAAAEEVTLTKEDLPPSIAEPLPEGNIIKGGDFNERGSVGKWNANTQTLTWIEDENGGYIECSGISVNYKGFIYKPGAIPVGKYKCTFYVRCAVPGEKSILRVNFYHGSTNTIYYLHPTSYEWLKVECYVDAPEAIYQITFAGSTNQIFTQDYCIDNFSMVPVEEIPENLPTDYYNGQPNTAAEIQKIYEANLPTYDMYDKEAEDALYKINGLFVNQDADSYTSASCSEQDIVDYAMSFVGTHITDYVICMNNTLSTFPSEVFEDKADKYFVRDEEGNIIGTDSYYAGDYHIFNELDTDCIGVWNDIFRENGINTWISFRMNDCHDRNVTDGSSKLLSNFYLNNPQYRRAWGYKGTNSYYNGCYDFKYQEIRDMWLAYIDEALWRYDVYGIELDYLRELFLFAIGEEEAGIPILNQFMRDVKAIVEKWEGVYGHDIKIGVRVSSDLATNLRFGADVATWVEEGILDMISPCGRFTTTDSTMPIGEWVELIGERDIILAPGIEMNIQPNPSSNSGSHTLETYCAYATSIFSQGADKVYLFNYYRNMSRMIKPEDRITTKDPKLSVGSEKQYFNIITTLGSYDKLLTMNRRMIMTYNDLEAPTKTPDSPLPAMAFMFSGINIKLYQDVGFIPEGSKVTLKFSMPNELYKDYLPDVFVNGVEVPYSGKSEYNTLGLTACPIFCYDVPAEAWNDGKFNMEFVPNEFTQIDYVEIYVEAPTAEAAE